MKIFYVIVCLTSARVLQAVDPLTVNAKAIERLSDSNDDVILSRIAEGLSDVKSSKCKSDVNYTIAAFRERKPWAVASKTRVAILASMCSLLPTRKEF